MSETLKVLFQQYFRCIPTEIRTLQAHASERKIFRLIAPGISVCGIESSNVQENQTFIYFAKHFKSIGLPVPEVYIVSDCKRFYLEEDLGDTTLFQELDGARSQSEPFPAVIEELYTQALTILPRFQVDAAFTLDFTKCFPVESFTSDSMLWDLNFFKSSFLQKIVPTYDEHALAADFSTLIDFLSLTPSTAYFMYRDFQSRNIMIKNKHAYFIDFQSGRRGPLQYDVASLLYQASARIPDDARERLLQVYLQSLAQVKPIDEKEFRESLGGFIAIRMMQVLGTYGKQGLENKKEYFLKSIPFAVDTLFQLSQRESIFLKLPELTKICYTLPNYVTFYR